MRVFLHHDSFALHTPEDELEISAYPDEYDGEHELTPTAATSHYVDLVHGGPKGSIVTPSPEDKVHASTWCYNGVYHA